MRCLFDVSCQVSCQVVRCTSLTAWYQTYLIDTWPLIWCQVVGCTSLTAWYQTYLIDPWHDSFMCDMTPSQPATVRGHGNFDTSHDLLTGDVTAVTRHMTWFVDKWHDYFDTSHDSLTSDMTILTCHMIHWRVTWLFWHVTWFIDMWYDYFDTSHESLTCDMTDCRATCDAGRDSLERDVTYDR